MYMIEYKLVTVDHMKKILNGTKKVIYLLF